MASSLNERQEVALTALREMGGAATVDQMVRAGWLSVNPDNTDTYGRQNDRIGWGRTFAALARRGLVRGVYQSDESAGASMVWTAAYSTDHRSETTDRKGP